MRERPELLRFTAQTSHPDESVEALVGAMLAQGLDVVHRYEPHGVSWVRLAGHQRVTIHTWPEHALATVDTLGLGESQVLRALSLQGWRVVQTRP